MSTAPTVQTLDQIMAELQPGYTAQRGVIQKGIQNTNETYKASQLALDAAKTQGFDQINRQAAHRGVAFGGIPLEEQANYLSTKYLPGLQQAKAQQQNDILTLEGQNAALDTDIRNKAFGSRETQQQSLNQWNLQQESQRAAAEAARIERDFRASEAAKERANQAASRNYEASQNANNAKKFGELVNNVDTYLSTWREKGKSYVSAPTWQKAKKKWIEAGGDADSFAATFSGYVNPSSKIADYGIF